MSLTHEAPRRRHAALKVYRLQFADMESRQKIQDFWHPESDRSLTVGEPMSVSGHEFSRRAQSRETAPREGAFMGISTRRSGDVARKRAVVINTLLERPQEFQGATPEVTQGLIRRNMDRIIHFARTLRNKGRLHPEVERILLSN